MANGETDTGLMEITSSSLFALIAGHAGYEVLPNPPGGDRKAIDFRVAFDEIDARVQVKSSSNVKFNRQGTLAFPIEDAWIARWRRNKGPTYLVLFDLPRAQAEWGTARSRGFFYRMPAYWTPIPKDVSGPSITIDRAHRFTVATLLQWAADAAKDGWS